MKYPSIPSNAAMNAEQMIDVLEKNWHPIMGTLYKLGRKTVEDHSQDLTVYDESGRGFMDFSTMHGVFSVGHSNKLMQEALQKGLNSKPLLKGQANQTNAQLMEKLAKLLPSDLQRCAFTHSGSEGIEIAMRAAFLKHQGKRTKVVVCENSYHGKSLAPLSLSTTPHFGSLSLEVIKVPYGDTQAMIAALDTDIAAVIVEPILGGGYLQTPPEGYLTAIADACKQNDVVFIADEIQTGLGRSGKLFAIEWDGVVPDAIVLSKGLTGGQTPFAVAVMRESLFNAINPKHRHLLQSASGGRFTACTQVASAALDYIVSNDLSGRSLELGEYFRAGLEKACADFQKVVLGVKGKGLMIGVQCANPAVENRLAAFMGMNGFATGHSMNEKAPHPVLRLYPPLIVTKDAIDQFMQVFPKALAFANQDFDVLNHFENTVAKHMYSLPKQFVFDLYHVK